MSIVKLSNNGVKNATTFGSISSLGSMTFIKKLTASSSATLSFVDGSDGVVLDSSFKEYVFTFNNIHPATNNVNFTFNMSTDGGSNYNVTKTTTYFGALHKENGTNQNVFYFSNIDLAQSTGDQMIVEGMSNESDIGASGELILYNPNSDTFVKHFMAKTNYYTNSTYSRNDFVAGYGNTVSSVNAFQFKFNSGNIDAGDICLYGIA